VVGLRVDWTSPGDFKGRVDDGLCVFVGGARRGHSGGYRVAASTWLERDRNALTSDEQGTRSWKTGDRGQQKVGSKQLALGREQWKDERFRGAKANRPGWEN
jgi:hypothetical protein